MGGIAPSQINQPRRARRGHPHRINQRKVLSRQVIADDAIEVGPEAPCQVLRGQRQFRRSHVVCRRVDEVAGERGRVCHSRDIGGVDAIGRYQPDVGRFGFAVAAEAIAAEREGEDREPDIVRRVGKTIDPRRQQARQKAGFEQVQEFAVALLEAEQDLRDLSVRGGQGEARSGFGGKAIGERELPGLRG